MVLQLQNRALQSCKGTHFRYSPLARFDKFSNFSSLRLKNDRVSCILTADHPKLKSKRIYHPFGSHVNGSRSILNVQPQLKVGFHNLSTCISIFSNKSSHGGGPYRHAFAKRSFSHVPKAVTSKNSDLGSRDERSGENISSFKVFNKHWKHAKSLPQGNYFKGGVGAAMTNQTMGEGASNSKISAIEKVDTVASRDQLVEGVKKNASKNKGKLKQQSGSLRSPKQFSDANATSSGAVQPKVSKRVSRAKKADIPKNNQSSLDLEVSKALHKISFLFFVTLY